MIEDITCKQGRPILNLRLAYVNVQCIRTKENLISLFLDNLKPNILCVSEHWMTSDEGECFANLGHLTLSSAYYRSKHKNGGAAIYVNRLYNFKPIDLNPFCDELNIELAGAELPQFQLIIVTAYRSPSGNLDIFFDQLDRCLAYLTRLGKPIVLGGDFNINLNVNSDTSNMFTYALRSNGLYITNLKPTRGDNCLDTVATNLNCWEYSTSVVRQVIADHYPVVIDINTKPVSLFNDSWHDQYVRKTRVINNGNLNYFRHLMLKDNWNLNSTTSLNDNNFGLLFARLRYNFDLACPEKTLRNTNLNQAKSRPSVKKSWYTNSLVNLKNLVVALHDKFKISFGDIKQTYYLNYLKAKKIYRSEVNLAKRRANMQKIYNAPNHCKAAWDLVKENHSKPILKCSASPDEFNKYLLAEVDRVVNEIPVNLIPEDPSLPITNIANVELGRWMPTNPEQVYRIILGFKSSQSPDIYGINVVALKHVADVIAAPLASAINDCLEQGVFPSELKVSRTVPVFKKGDPELLSSYRPISIIPVLAKVFETIIKGQLVRYFEDNHLFSKNQHGFRKRKSTFSAVLKLVTNILDSFEHKGSMALILADLSKAFDCVSHCFLLEKLKRYGISGQAFNLIKSYLENRTQVMSIGGAKSSPLAVRHGVPQGSVLGPVLFLIDINDIDLLGDILMFADDTTIFSEGKTPNDARLSAELIFSKAKEWFTRNKLCLNEGKTQKMVCSLQVSNMPDNSTVKLLGFTIDPKLTWNQHVNSVCTKLSRVTFLLRRLKLQLLEEHLITVYHGLFHSHLSYGLLLWGHSPGCKAVLLLQKKSLRIISSSGHIDHCRPIFRRLKILTIYSQYILLSLLHVKENLDSLSTRSDCHNYNLRKAHDLNVPFCRLSKMKDCFPTLAYRMFNLLPLSVRQLKDSAFKKRVKKWLLDEAFYSLEEFFGSDFSSV